MTRRFGRILAATPELVFTGAGLINQHQQQVDLHVTGTVTCSAPTGQTELSLMAIQVIGGIGTAEGSVLVTCAAGPVFWEAELDGFGLHPGYLNVLGTSTRNGVEETFNYQDFTVS